MREEGTKYLLSIDSGRSHRVHGVGSVLLFYKKSARAGDSLVVCLVPKYIFLDQSRGRLNCRGIYATVTPLRPKDSQVVGVSVDHNGDPFPGPLILMSTSTSIGFLSTEL